MLATMPAHTSLPSEFERQLLTQLGERLRAARQSLGMTAVDVAGQAGVSRMTLRAVESGEPSPTIGTYVRVMSVLGMAGDLVLVGTGASGRSSAQLSFQPVEHAGAPARERKRGSS